MTRALLPLALLLTAATGAQAAGRVSLGVFERWGAFREDAPALRCWALTRGARSSGGVLRVGFWPRPGARAQVSVTPPSGREAREGALHAGEVRVALRGNGATLWTLSPADDARVVAAMRGGADVVVSTRNWQSRFAAAGAATAIDAAAIGCSR